MSRAMRSRRALLLALALLGGLRPSVSFGQQIYWTASGKVWKMNSNGSAQAEVFPGGMNVPPGFAFGDNASERGNVAGPTTDGWFVYTLEPGPDAPAGAGYELFAFTADVTGGAVWTQLTDFSGTGIDIIGAARLPQDGSGSFVSFTVVDRTVTPNASSVVRLDNPLGRMGPAGPGDVTPISTATAPESVGDASWNPTGDAVVLRRNHLYPDGGVRPQLVVHDLTTGLDRVVVDPTVSGLSPGAPVWSPTGDSIAFVNGQVGTGEGIYTVPAGGGAARVVINATRGGGGFYEFYTPVWAPDASALVSWEIHAQFAWNNYDKSAVSKLTLGKKNASVTVLSPWYPWANRAIPFGWR